jgi:DMSO reductase anchor subunit
LFGVDLGAGFMQAVILLLFAAIVIKLTYWQYIDSTPHRSTPESAIGTPSSSTVSEFTAPHTEENHLLKEMGFQIGRKHGEKLRQIAAVAFFAIPTVLLVLAILVSRRELVTIFSLAAAVSVTLGVIVERWLFFAQARHIATL